MNIKTDNISTRAFDDLNYTNETINTVFCMFQDNLELQLSGSLGYINSLMDIVEEGTHSIYNISDIPRKVAEQIELNHGKKLT